ncbi:hypothetical protein BU090_09165 [Staphylococcus warneri]|uniref:hypothetical protein n=1 Tax=Staphylococcus TaxID=1279 RepID=UPI000D1D45EF|nr:MULTISPECIES: hypothetical protein [Staphylococcus]TXZ91472.1 hypothetical protein FXE30_19825 [Vibrio cholerae]HBI7123600.1 hypothetical protein [Clostridium perfringens]MDK4265726.1 hypothetical protein [Staphylococcus warneri]MEB6613483.1 hypothetical protein [Staphylococcus pasteuri]PTI59899.1 hypothetical protein BU090_09165 [Staphylococcus warneri]
MLRIYKNIFDFLSKQKDKIEYMNLITANHLQHLLSKYQEARINLAVDAYRNICYTDKINQENKKIELVDLTKDFWIAIGYQRQLDNSMYRFFVNSELLDLNELEMFFISTTYSDYITYNKMTKIEYQNQMEKFNRFLYLIERDDTSENKIEAIREQLALVTGLSNIQKRVYVMYHNFKIKRNSRNKY